MRQCKMIGKATAFLYLSVLTLAFFPVSNLFAQTCSSNEISGSVFLDLDADGQKDANEPGVPGISVSAYDSSNVLVKSVDTDGDGKFQHVATGAALRLELVNLPAHFYPGASTAPGNTFVQFSDGTARCDLDIALSSPAKYCEDDPWMFTPCYVNGDPLAGGNSGPMDALVAYRYSEEGIHDPLYSSPNAAEPKHLSINEKIGTTWGLAYQKSTQTLIAAAFLKRHAGWGPLGIGGLYTIDVSDIDNAVTNAWFDIKSLGINVGSVTRSLSANIQDPNYDEDAWGKVGRVGLGDIDISEDGSTLYVVNLFDKSVYAFPLQGNPIQVPTTFTKYEIENPGCSDDDYVPFGLTHHNGQLFVSVTCTAETSKQRSDLAVYVLRQNADMSFSSVVDSPLDEPRGWALIGLIPQIPLIPPVTIEDYWEPWAGTWADFIAGNTKPWKPFPQWNFITRPQPLASDIVIDADGSMYIGMTDITGHQLGVNNFVPDTSENYIANAPSGGDLYKACAHYDTATGDYLWVMESNGSCPGGTPTGGQNNGQGFDGGEFFFEENLAWTADPTTDAHQELAQGGLGLKAGSNEVVTSFGDPFRYETAGSVIFNTQDGTRVRGYELVPPRMSSFGKAIGVGDYELLCSLPSLEIGNRIWRDANKNGIQDAGEEPIAGVTVELCDVQGNTLKTVVTDAQGHYIFQDVQPETSYSIKLANVADYQEGGPLHSLEPTQKDQGSNDSVDSDCGVHPTTGMPTLSLVTGVSGESNHTFDCGFSAMPIDCAGTPGGTKVNDICGVCDGDGTSCLDCAGVPNGTSVEDECGVCGGTGKDICNLCPSDSGYNEGPDNCNFCPQDPGHGENLCAACADINIQEHQFVMDQGVKKQEAAIKRAAGLVKRTYRRYLPQFLTKKLLSKLRKFILRAEVLETRAWVTSWSVESVQSSCDSSSLLCVQNTQNQDMINAYLQDEAEIHGIFIKVSKLLRKALKRANRPLKLYKKLTTKENTIHTLNVQSADQIPPVVTQCFGRHDSSSKDDGTHVSISIPDSEKGKF